MSAVGPREVCGDVLAFEVSERRMRAVQLDGAARTVQLAAVGMPMLVPTLTPEDREGLGQAVHDQLGSGGRWGELTDDDREARRGAGERLWRMGWERAGANAPTMVICALRAKAALLRGGPLTEGSNQRKCPSCGGLFNLGQIDVSTSELQPKRGIQCPLCGHDLRAPSASEAVSR